MNTPSFDIEKLDFNALRKSKLLLLELEHKIVHSSEQKELLMTLVHLIDGIQDDLVDNLGYDENDIYLFENESN